MKYLLLKVLIATIALLINPEISHGLSVIFDTGINPCKGIRQVDSGKAEQIYLNLELKAAGSKPSGNGEKVETIVILRPATSFSETKQVNFNNLPNVLFSKKASSLASYQYGFLSGLTDLSLLVNILRN